jgi:hypothetical protein
MAQKVRFKLSVDPVKDDDLELEFESPSQFSRVASAKFSLTREQAVSLGKVIRAKYGDD